MAHREVSAGISAEQWPELPLAQWKDTYATLHMWTQIVGKIRLACTPKINHWWNSTYYITPRGMTTSTMYRDGGAFQIDFDFIDHLLRFETSSGRRADIELTSKTTATFYREVMETLDALGIEVEIWPHPVEIEDPIPFAEDEQHATYIPEHAHRFWQVLLASEQVFQEVRAGFVGKSSPVHFFWGSFDLALTRFSLREAPPHPGGVPNMADWVTREAYSHECSSCGFWPGTEGGLAEPAYYSYAYPVPDGFKDYPVRPRHAFYSEELGEFVLLYKDLRRCADPAAVLRQFLESTYEAAATCGAWPRDLLEPEDPSRSLRA